jgi:dihydroorotate dehydrogenase (fumarate)
LIEEAGADALELNVYYLSTSVRDSSADIEAQIESLVRKLKGLIRIPIAVKTSPFFTAFGALAVRLEAAGADGPVFFNRYYQPDVDIDTLQTLPNLHLSTSAELLLRLRWLGILSERVKISLGVTGGVHGVMDGIKAVLSGAHAVQMVSAVLQQGPQHFRELEQGLSAWMTRHMYDSIEAFRGSLNLSRYGDPTHFERAGSFRCCTVREPDAIAAARSRRPDHRVCAPCISIQARRSAGHGSRTPARDGPACRAACRSCTRVRRIPAMRKGST